MRLCTQLIFSLSIFFSSVDMHLYSHEQESGITYALSGGRFGDNLLAYLHAKWLSYKYDIPLVYQSFPFSNQLMIHDTEKHYSYKTYRSHAEILLQDEKDLAAQALDRPHLFVCPHFPEDAWERKTYCPGNFYCKVDWEDPGFREHLKDLLPKQALSLITPPSDTVNIAIHYREGGNHDTTNEFQTFLTKFPPLDFYIENLQKILALFPNQKIYCYLFTDAINPPECIEKMQMHLQLSPLQTIHCHENSNRNKIGVLEDFFSLFNFDILIHSQSNFSLIPSLIHDFAITCAPVSAHRKGSKTIVDQTDTKIRQHLYEQLLSR